MKNLEELDLEKLIELLPLGITIDEKVFPIKLSKGHYNKNKELEYYVHYSRTVGKTTSGSMLRGKTLKEAILNFFDFVEKNNIITNK